MYISELAFIWSLFQILCPRFINLDQSVCVRVDVGEN